MSLHSTPRLVPAREHEGTRPPRAAQPVWLGTGRENRTPHQRVWAAEPPNGPGMWNTCFMNEDAAGDDRLQPDYDALQGKPIPEPQGYWERWATQILSVAILMFIPILVWFSVVQQGQASKLQQLRDFTAASRVNRIEFQATQNFLLCSRAGTIIKPIAQRDVDTFCAGYDTLDEALTAEQAKQAASQPS